jgi:hypothetical protein
VGKTERWVQGAILGVSLAVVTYTVVGAAVTRRVMDQADRQVMAEHLRRGGYGRVQVENGSLVTAGGNLVAVMNIRLADGQTMTIKYPLGPVDDAGLRQAKGVAE